MDNANMSSKGQHDDNTSTSTKALCALDNAHCEDTVTAAAAAAATMGGGSVTGVCKLTFNLLEELQGDSSLEPGEVITPPHGSIKETDNNRDMSSKKGLSNNTLSKVMKKKSAAPNGDSDNDDDDGAVRAKTAKTAAADEDDDSEGLYSGSDSTGDEEKMNKPDVARYEMHPKPVSQPIVENFQSMPPFKNFMHMPRFMPRVPMSPLRGGMRPAFFRHRAPGFHMHSRAFGPNLVPRHMLRLKTPPPHRGHSPIRTSKVESQRLKSTSPTPPALNNARAHGVRTPRRHLSPVHRETDHERTPKEHVLWTTAGKHDVKWSINSKLRSRIDDMCRDYYNEGKSKSRKVNSSQSRKPEKSKNSEKTRKKHHAMKSTKKVVDRAPDIEAADPEKSVNGKSKDMRKMFDIFAESPPRTKETATESDAKQTIPLLLNIKQEKIDPTDLPSPVSVAPTVIQCSTSPPRSTTPPLADLLESKTKNPLIRAIAVQSRIDKLLQENDLELEELLATKESLLRKTREHRKLSSVERQQKRIQVKQEHSNERSVTEIKSKTEEHLSSSNGNSLNERNFPPVTHEPIQPIQRFKRESSPWEEEELSLQPHIKVNLSPALDTATKSKLNPFKQTQTVLGENACFSLDKTKREQDKGAHSTHDSLDKAVKVERQLPNGYIKMEKQQQEETPKMNVNKNENIRQTCDDESTSDSASKSTNDSKAAPSPDTDDYIDNWENDDSTATCEDTQTKLYRNDTSNSNQLWNAKSTPLPKAVVPRSNTPESTPPPSGAAMQNKPIIDMQEMYDKFLKSIKMNAETEGEVLAAAATTASGTTESSESSNASSSNSSNNSNSRENGNETQESKVMPRATGDESITQASVDSQDTIKKSSEQDAQTAKNNVSRDLKRLKTLEGNLARIQMMRENYDSGDELCEELVKMESLFLAEKSAIMAKYRKTDLKLSDTSKKATPLVTLDIQQQDASLSQSPQPELPEANNIFDANREAIKLKLSPLKLTRKAAIFERDEPESATQTTQTEQDFTETLLKPKPAKEIAIVKPMMDTKLKRGTMSPTPILSRRVRQRSRSHSRSRRRSISRSRIKSSPSRSISPRRRRAYSPIPRSHSRGNRYHMGLRGRSRSRSRSFSPKRSLSRSRSRSRSVSRRRHLKFTRKRGSYSPPPLGPRSPPTVSRRRSYSRERYSRSPLPFKPPSPPMRRSCSSSPSRSRSPHSNSPYAHYFMANHSQDEAAYYYANMPHSESSMDAHMSLMLNEIQDSSADPNLDIGYENYTGYTSYMDGGYLASEDGGYYTQQYMPHQAEMYAQMGNAASEFGYYYNEFGELLPSTSVEPSRLVVVANTSVLKELPKAPAVAVQKGNVLEIVPSGELQSSGTAATITAAEAAAGVIITPTATATASIQPMAVLSEAAKAAAKAAKQARREARQQRILERKKAAEAAAAAEKSSGKKKVNFEDRISTNHESEEEDEKIVEKAVQRAIKRHRARVEKLAKRATNKTAKAQQAASSGMPPLPPPPIKPDGPPPQQLKYLLKKPTIRYYHFDSQMGIMYFSYARVPKPLRFNPKCMPMFFNANKVPVPMSVPGAALTSASDGAEPKEIMIPTHPPPPLGQAFDAQLPPPNVGSPTQLPPPHMRYIGMRMNNFMSLRAPAQRFVQTPQPIPVVGMSYQPAVSSPCLTTLHEPTYALPPSTAMPYVPAEEMEAAATVVGAQSTPQHFNVTPIPSITEITPVEITPAAVAAALADDIAPTDEQLDDDSSESQPEATALPANVTLIPIT